MAILVLTVHRNVDPVEMESVTDFLVNVKMNVAMKHSQCQTANAKKENGALIVNLTVLIVKLDVELTVANV
jgi:hypothetical protein